MDSPRWLADEMVGRLARYLRFVGYDTVYARGLPDDEIIRWAAREDRVVLTRDRALANRARRAVLLTELEVDGQWTELRRAVPGLREQLRFERCSECNGVLVRTEPAEGSPGTSGLPWERIRQGLAVYVCPDCHHYYWDGSHTDAIRRTLSKWASPRGA